MFLVTWRFFLFILKVFVKVDEIKYCSNILILIKTESSLFQTKGVDIEDAEQKFHRERSTIRRQERARAQ